MEYVRITPLGHNYLAHIDFRDIELSNEQIEKICYEINTFWIDEKDYEQNYWANDMGSFDSKYNIIELPKSYFINNNGGYELKDVIEELIDDKKFGLYDQIISCIRNCVEIDDEIILQWDIKSDFENNFKDIEEVEDDIREYIREAYSLKYDDLIWKLDKIYTELVCLTSDECYTTKYCNTEGVFHMSTLDDIEDDIFDGFIILHKDMSDFAKMYDFHSHFDVWEMPNISEDKKEKIIEILEKYDNIVQ